MDRQELSRILASLAMLELLDYRVPGTADLYSDMTREELKLIQLVTYQRERNQKLMESLTGMMQSQKETNALLAESNAMLSELMQSV